MTYEEYKSTISNMKKLLNEGKLTKEECQAFVKIMKLLQGKCFKCVHNDGHGSNFCWNCDD